MHRSTSLRILAVAAVTVAAACGGDDASGPAVADPTVATTAASEPAAEPDDADTATASDPDEAEPGDVAADDGDAADSDSDGPLERGDDRIRLVNLLDDPVDVYVRTTGQVRTELVLAGLAPGEVTPYLAPPPGGRIVALEAGADDPDCVSQCPQIVASVATDPQSGPVLTAVVFTDARDDQVRTFTAYELPPDDVPVMANVMPDPDLAAALVVPLGIALRDAEFGLQLAVDGADGCRANRDDSNVLVGGTTTTPFVFDSGPSTTVTFHSNRDRDCADDPVGGPFTVSTEAGTRTLLVLSGAPGSMEAIELPLSESVPDHDTDDASPITPGG